MNFVINGCTIVFDDAFFTSYRICDSDCHYCMLRSLMGFNFFLVAYLKTL